MPDTHRVIITAVALSDLEEIAAYIRQHSPDSAPRVAETILTAVDSLEFMPARYKRVGKSRKHGTPVHSLVVHPFIIYYRVQAAPPAVYILTIRHGARRQPRRFE